MKIMVVGGGGREHALVWKLSLSPRVSEIICVPGNGGIADIARCIHFDVENINGLLDLACSEGIDLTVVGPEVPLTLGIVDAFEAKGMRIFGPSKEAAVIEGSKKFMKDFLVRNKIPTASYASFTNPVEAKKYVREMNRALVVKADGLAGGKGVLICADSESALSAVETVMEEKAFGSAGGQVVIEEFLEGEEASFMAFSDGETVVPMVSSQDHKRVFDGDKGPNTGGMGAYSPAPVITPSMHEKIMKEVMIPAVEGMKKEGRTYKGVLYGGVMINDGEIRVLEFNCRFGDPETQPVLMRLDTDIVTVIDAVIDGTLSDVKLSWKEENAVCVVMAAKGYPGSYEKGEEISVPDSLKNRDDVFVFHAGTLCKDGKIVSSGGRVLGVTALGNTVDSAVKSAYSAVEQIEFNNSHFRKDIAYRAVGA